MISVPARKEECKKLMYYGKVEICGINTAKLPVLTESEKTELLKRAKSGDKAARETMINGNLRLVLSVIQRFTNRTTFFRSAALVLSRQSTILTQILMYAFPHTAYP